MRETSEAAPWILVVGGPRGSLNRSWPWSWPLSGDGRPGGLEDILVVEVCDSRCMGASSNPRAKELGSIDGFGCVVISETGR